MSILPFNFNTYSAVSFLLLAKAWAETFLNLFRDRSLVTKWVKIVLTQKSDGWDLFSLVKCDWSPSSAKISFIVHDLHSLQFDCGLKCMRPNLGDLIILKPPEDGGIFLLLSIFFLQLYFSHSSTVSWGISEGTRVSPRLRQSTTPGHELWWHLTQELAHKKTILGFCSELTMRTFAGLRTLCSAGAEMLSKIILI